jgi:arylsulfatase A-like enzyme
MPMFISGKSVSRTGIDNNLIVSTDLFATIAELTGSTSKEIHDSKSITSLLSQSVTIRDYQYSEIDDETKNQCAISNGTYKLLVNSAGDQEMYNLTNDPYESNNLLNGTLSPSEQDAKTELEVELSNIRN